MYAVIRTGGKQEKVEPGQRVRVERLGLDHGADITFEPLLLVDGDSILAGADLGGASVTARVVGDEQGPKIRGFKYKNKSNQRRRWGHRQKYDLVEITGITKG